MSIWLRAAGVYNILWGSVVVIFPHLFFSLLEIPAPEPIEIWQCVGMIVGVYGLGYWIAASDPLRHWPIVLVGLLGKVFGPIGFSKALYEGVFPIEFAWTILTNDLIWWLPFSFILIRAFQNYATVPTAEFDPREKEDFLQSEFPHGSQQLLVFLRHSGCNFHKEAIEKLEKLPLSKAKLHIVHMGREEKPKYLAKESPLQSARWISDPELKLYSLFEIPKANWGQILNFRVLWNALRAFLKGHSVGKLEGDGFQMHAAFLIKDQKIYKTYASRDVSDLLFLDQLEENL